MRLVRFDGSGTGVVLGEAADRVLDVSATIARLAGDPGTDVLRDVLPAYSASWTRLIERWDEARGPLQGLVDRAEAGDTDGLVVHAISALTLDPPTADPAVRIFALGGNFAAHLEHTVNNVQDMPASISKPRDEDSIPWGFTVLPGSLVGTGAVVTPPVGFEKFDYEGEVGVVLRETVVAGDPGSARIFGYMAWNDFSIRDHVLGLSGEDHGPLKFALTKNFDSGNGVGPWLVVVEDDAEVDDLVIECRINGELRQSASTSGMTWSFAEVAAHVSKFLTLGAGDMVLSGSPGGTAVESGFDGPFLKDGDVAEVTVSGAGTLTNRIAFPD